MFRSFPVCAALFVLLGSRAAAGEVDLATATVPSRTLNVGDWVLYEHQGRSGREVSRDREELWTVVEVTSDAALFSVESNGETEWIVLPMHERELPALWPMAFAQGNLRPSSRRPTTLTPQARTWEPPPTDGPNGSKCVTSVRRTGRKLRMTQRTTTQQSAIALEVEVELDVSVPVLGVKSVKWTYEARAELVDHTTERSVRAKRHGAGAEAAPTPAKSERRDIAKLRRATLEADPFADVVPGAKATFRAVRNSSRPIGGKTRSEGRIEVTVVSKGREGLTLRFQVLEGRGDVARHDSYERVVSVEDMTPREPHRYILSLLPMVTGELGSGGQCTCASRRDTTASIGGSSLPAEAIVLTFDKESRYEATFCRGSPVGFVAVENRFSLGLEDSWEEIRLTLDD